MAEMLFLDELDRHSQLRSLEAVVLRYSHARAGETVYEWRAQDGKPSDCWVAQDGRVYLPADERSLALTDFFHCEVVMCREEQKIRYIRMKQLKDEQSRETNKLWVEADGITALAGEEHVVTQRGRTARRTN